MNDLNMNSGLHTFLIRRMEIPLLYQESEGVCEGEGEGEDVIDGVL